MSRYRKDNKFRKAWDRATPEQRNAFRLAFSATEVILARVKNELKPVYDALQFAWEAVYDKDEPVDLACLLYEMQGMGNHVEKAYDDMLECLGPGWQDPE